MARPGPRSLEQRKADTLDLLSAPNADVWVATAAASGTAHLVPLSLAWNGTHVLLALEGTSRTARNLDETRHARLGVGSTRDVVMVDVGLDASTPVADADPALAEAYASQADWDPRSSGPSYVLLTLRPVRIQAWREEDEIADRTIMRAGEWTV